MEKSLNILSLFISFEKCLDNLLGGGGQTLLIAGFYFLFLISSILKMLLICVLILFPSKISSQDKFTSGKI